MNPLPSTSWRRPLFAIAAIALVFAAVITGLTLNLRSALRGEILQREAEAIEAVATMQLRTAPADLVKMGLGDDPQAIFGAVLESSRLRGVLAVQLFNANGELLQSLPLNETSPEGAWWIQQITANRPAARFHPRGNLESVYGIADIHSRDALAAPLLEVTIPIRKTADLAPLGIAHYWIDGESVAHEFARIDRGLTWQASMAFLISVLALAGALAWAFARVEKTNQRLRAQGEDLARANHELAFVAKTAAIGAISAHLIHEIKNPLTGLECLVSYQVAKPEDPALKESWQMAADATRRLREMINQVLGMLREEASSGSEYTVNASDVVEAVATRVAGMANKRGVKLATHVPTSLEMSSRSSNLAGLILTNLTSNALEASPAGSEVTLAAALVEDKIEFEVADAGPGLPASVQENLFQPLASGKPGGTGIGLAISRQLAQHLGGRLALRRTGPDGTVFTLAIPALMQTETRADKVLKS